MTGVTKAFLPFSIFKKYYYYYFKNICVGFWGFFLGFNKELGKRSFVLPVFFRAVRGSVEHGVQSGSGHGHQVVWQHHRVRPVDVLGQPHPRHPPADGGAVGLPTHSPSPLVGASLCQTLVFIPSYTLRLHWLVLPSVIHWSLFLPTHSPSPLVGASLCQTLVFIFKVLIKQMVSNTIVINSFTINI